MWREKFAYRPFLGSLKSVVDEVAVDKTVDLASLFEFFRSEASGKSGAAASYYSRAVAGFEAFLATRGEESCEITSGLIADWFISMISRGLTLKTATLYLNSVSGVYRKAIAAGLAEPTGAFRDVKERLKALSISGNPDSIDFLPLDRAHRLFRAVAPRGGENALARDILLFSLLNGCMPPYDIALLTKDCLPELSPELKSIAMRNVSPRRKYIFDLGQSMLTTVQLRKAVAHLFAPLRLDGTLPQAPDLTGAVASLWALAALRRGIPASEVVAFLAATPPALPHLAVAESAKLSDERRTWLADAVGQTFISNPMRWYAMRIRPGRTFDELRSRLDTLPASERPELFYPFSEIARKLHKRIVFRQTPVIKNVVFFRCGEADVFALAARIADIAWIYTSSGRTGDRFAVIPDAHFHQFRIAVGSFDASTFSAEALTVGTEMQVISGIFEGIEASISKIDSAEGRNILHLLYSGSNAIRWSITLDPSQTQPKPRPTP